MGEDSCSKGHEFKSWRRVLDGYFFTLICCKNCIVCLKRQKRKEKEARVGPFKKILKDLGGRNWNFFLVHFELETNLVSYQAAAASKTFFFKFGQNSFEQRDQIGPFLKILVTNLLTKEPKYFATFSPICEGNIFRVKLLFGPPSGNIGQLLFQHLVTLLLNIIFPS